MPEDSQNHIFDHTVIMSFTKILGFLNYSLIIINFFPEHQSFYSVI